MPALQQLSFCNHEQLAFMIVHDRHASQSKLLYHFCLSSFEKVFNANLMRLGFVCSWVPG